MNILILGASGTVGNALFRRFSSREDWNVFGTYFTKKPENNFHMMPFSVENPAGILPVLEQVQPDIVISALRGDFEKQIVTHELTADYLTANHGRFLYFSSSNVFDGSTERPHFETDTRFSVSDYGRFKIRCEDLLCGRMGDQAVIIRLPFVWGENSPRLQAVKAGCEAGEMQMYHNFWCNHVSVRQIADLILWIIQEGQKGVFHAGTEDVTEYQAFIERLIAGMGWKLPRFVWQEGPGMMAVLSNRTDVPDLFQWDSERLIGYLAGKQAGGSPVEGRQAESE